MNPESPHTNRTYEATKRVGWQAAACIAGGTLFLLILFGQFFLTVLSKPSSKTNIMPGMIGGLSVIGIGLIARGVFLLRTVQRVIVDSAGVHVEGFIGRQTVPWGHIAQLQRDKKSLWMGDKTYQVLTLKDTAGKTLTTIQDNVEHFEDLIQQIESESSRVRGSATFDPSADEQRRLKKERRTHRWTTIACGAFALFFGAILIVGINEELHTRRYASDGATTDAQILRRWMVSVTPRIEYSFLDERGQSHQRQAMMDQPDWDLLEGQKTVAVEYLRSDPSWNRLVAGEKQETSFGGKFLFLSAGGTLLLSAFFLMLLFGFDVKVEDGVTKLTRRGKVLREFGSPT